MAVVTSFRCPSCSVQLELADTESQSCTSCGWKGRARLFRPVELRVNEPEVALPEDATCVHHLEKRAIATCGGTGDFICDLCCIEVDGQAYSAQYLEWAGKGLAGKSFERYLTRPERVALHYQWMCILPCCVGFPAWIVLGFLKLRAANRMRGEEPLYARVVGRGRLVVQAVLLALTTLFFMGLAIVLIIRAVEG